MSEFRAWRLRTDGEQEVVFSSIREGSSFLAYWSPNREYYEATVVETTHHTVRSRSPSCHSVEFGIGDGLSSRGLPLHCILRCPIEAPLIVHRSGRACWIIF